MTTTRIALGLAPLVLVLGSGCISTVDYAPSGAVLDEIGPHEAERQLGEVLGRAIEPRAASVTVGDSSYMIVWNETIHGMYGIPMGSRQRTVEVHFANVSKLQLYENNNVFVHGHDGGVRQKVQFSSRSDATLFIDLVWALRDRRATRNPRGGY